MAAYAFDWVDAFTAQPFGGNGCVVVHGAADISYEDRLALVRETSLAECAYMVGSDVADFGVRYYLADKEILMAGHPTVATVASLLDRGMVRLEGGLAEFTLEVGAGVLPIRVEDTTSGPLITMTQAAPSFGKQHEPARIAAIYGLSADDILGTPQTVSTGTPFCITVLKSRDALRRAQMDVGALEAFRAYDGSDRASLMEPFLVTLGGETEAGDTFSRLLLAPPSLPEDPFTGSATGCMAAYLWHHGLIEAPRFTAEQGHWMGRPGQAQVEVLGPREAITGVKVGGQARVLMRGELAL
ncbi:PhzF family phenazine biosynthesis protein [Pseudoruegeria sp. SHC-113]|uniref:PhzF family phenazine biosynthesis protein n=1 Tax=Pseudoruegeria sp. SHC-113 TaxID=2855439 RepID=UPI0021BAC974|nr:PhzF family phenazine biosynthesis protein [Pseudoruegeria sp. SHC-113]MCT8159654.1 PhzF family phenazine biosynthesis protein [Pseudoruegeria sp. SHC-113]